MAVILIFLSLIGLQAGLGLSMGFGTGNSLFGLVLAALLGAFVGFPKLMNQA